MKSILITGGAGFIGSNFVEYFMNKYPEYRIIVLDNLTYAGNLKNLSSVSTNPNFIFIKGDICDQKLIQEIFSKYQFHGVINFAAESHVDNSINTPDIFIKTNINGTFNLLQEAKTLWMNDSFEPKVEFLGARFHHISTDEVFGTLGSTGFFTENTPYAPNSPYSASKAASDFLVRSYCHTYGLNVVTTNCSNNFGPRQHPEKLIPTVIRTALSEKPIPIYGSGKNVRDWLFVLDHCEAIDLVFHKGKKGDNYLIGGDNELTNIDITLMLCSMLDKEKPRKNGQLYKELITFVTDRPGHDLRYAVDCSKIKEDLNWISESKFEMNLLTTIKYYLNE